LNGNCLNLVVNFFQIKEAGDIVVFIRGQHNGTRKGADEMNKSGFDNDWETKLDSIHFNIPASFFE
jgi:hypothetical protein